MVSIQNKFASPFLNMITNLRKELPAASVVSSELLMDPLSCKICSRCYSTNPRIPPDISVLTLSEFCTAFFISSLESGKVESRIFCVVFGCVSDSCVIAGDTHVSFLKHLGALFCIKLQSIFHPVMCNA